MCQGCSGWALAGAYLCQPLWSGGETSRLKTRAWLAVNTDGPVMTLQVQAQVTHFWKMFTPSFLNLSGFFFFFFFLLLPLLLPPWNNNNNKRKKKSSGSSIEFESLYFSPIVVFQPSCHGDARPLFSLSLPFLARADFLLCCARVFYIYHKICRARPVWKPETMNYVETYF